MIILKVTKKQGFNHSPENRFLKKPHRWGECQIHPHPLFLALKTVPSPNFWNLFLFFLFFFLLSFFNTSTKKPMYTLELFCKLRNCTMKFKKLSRIVSVFIIWKTVIVTFAALALFCVFSFHKVLLLFLAFA